MTRNQVRRIASRLACAGAAGGLALLPVSVPASATPAPTASLGGWNVTADGNVVDIVIDNATGLAGIHPFTEADFPEAQSTFETGPFGSGLATVFWPGSAGGNFGSLSAELGLPSQLAPLLGKLNDPVRASTQYPAGPLVSDFPKGAPSGAIEMHAESNASGTSAVAALSDETVPKLVTFSSAKGTSSSTAASTANGTASSDLSGVSLLGGLIDIGSITSTANASSNGTSATGSAITHIGQITVLGQPASLGSDGLVLPNLSNKLGPFIGPVVQNLLTESIDALGLKLTQFPNINTINGAAATESAGGIQLELTPPASAAPLLEQLASLIAPFFPPQAAIIPTLPGLLQGSTVTITLGRAAASAAASPPFSSNFTPPPVPPTIPPATTGVQPIASITTPGTPATAGSSAPSFGGGQQNNTTTTTTQPANNFRPNPISLSAPLAAGFVALGLIVAGALGYGLWRLAGLMDAPEDVLSVCPLGQDAI